MGKVQLRNKLELLPKENVIKLIMEIYDNCKEARPYLDHYVEPNSIDDCERFKQTIRKEFFPVRGVSEKPSFAACRKAISDFKKMKPDPYFLADLMLYYIENGCEYTMTYGDMWEQYYVTLEGNFKKAMEHISKYKLLPLFYTRIEQMLNATDCGWGFYDTLWKTCLEHKNNYFNMT